MTEGEAEVIARAAEEPSNQRAIKLVPYLNRATPFWGNPGYLSGQRWRAVVRQQPIAIICRDTLIQNIMAMGWSVRQREPSEVLLQIEKDEIDHYTDVFDSAENGFNNYVSLLLQDMLDLPFGAMSEQGRLNDDPEGPVMWTEHVDAATLMPTGNYDWPVVQNVPGAPARPIVFPSHAIDRMMTNPLPEIRRKGWGMAPPEKIYLAITMLFRGDRYYANLLLDTPEAGILDLMNMSEEDAEEWLDSWRNLMMGIDGMKVPVLYGHDTAAQWIPLNRPPIDLMYDSTTIKYAAICAAGYGIRLSDIGMEEQAGERTLAGVIRGERQSRRTGRAQVRSMVEDHFDKLLPDHLQFIFEEKDEEAKTEQARALSTYGLALGQLKRDGLLTGSEARTELVATGLLETEIDPNIEPVPEVPMGMPGQATFEKPGTKEERQEGKQKEKPRQGPGKPTDADRGKVRPEDRGRVSPTQGGRGGLTPRAHSVDKRRVVPGEAPFDDNITSMLEIVAPSIKGLPDLAASAGGRQFRKSGPKHPIPSAPRLRRLIKETTKALVPTVEKTFESLSDAEIQRTWLPEMQAIDFGLPSELDSLILRQTAEEIRELLESHLNDDQWWRVASAWEKDKILELYIAAYQVGLEEQAIAIVRALYEDALLASPELSVATNFELVNPDTLAFLERSAAEMVTHVDEGTKFFIKRITVAGVRQGLSRPIIAQAIRDGVAAEELLRREGFMADVSAEIVSGLTEMSETRSQSIALTEISRATNLGHLDQIIASGLKLKAWTHLGPRGITKKGNEHPCPVCSGNENLGFVKADFLFDTVFSSGGPKNDGRALTPPGHPNVCHCTNTFSEDELKATVKRGEYLPYLGGKTDKKLSGDIEAAAKG